jgi:hypothetical protein
MVQRSEWWVHDERDAVEWRVCISSCEIIEALDAYNVYIQEFSQDESQSSGAPSRKSIFRRGAFCFRSLSRDVCVCMCGACLHLCISKRVVEVYPLRERAEMCGDWQASQRKHLLKSTVLAFDRRESCLPQRQTRTAVASDTFNNSFLYSIRFPYIASMYINFYI